MTSRQLQTTGCCFYRALESVTAVVQEGSVTVNCVQHQQQQDLHQSTSIYEQPAGLELDAAEGLQSRRQYGLPWRGW